MDQEGWLWIYLGRKFCETSIFVMRQCGTAAVECGDQMDVLPDTMENELHGSPSTAHKMLVSPDNNNVPLQSISEQVGEDDLHCHRPPPEHSKKARNQLLAVVILCVCFMAFEIFGGLLSGSLALLTDACHLASDIAGFIVSLFALWVAKKPASAKMSFGFYRAEVIGALVSVFIIWIMTAVLCYLAVERIISNDFEINANEMLLTASLGVFFNIVMGAVLHLGLCCKCNVPHSHSHGHSHHNQHLSQTDETPYENQKGHLNINVRAAFIHIIGDFIQSIGVLIAAIIIKIQPGYKMADPICTFLFSILVVITTATVLRDVLFVFMEAVPRGIDFNAIKRSLQSLEHVQLAHSLNVWALTMDKMAVSVHLAIDRSADWNSVVKQATRLLRQRYGAFHSTVQVELFQEHVMNNCSQCQCP